MIKRISTVCVLAVLAGCPKAPEPDPIPASPKITTFTATPGSVATGGMTTLKWEVANAESVTIADAARGAVSGVDNKPSGSVTVQVPSTTLFVLTALNARGAKATAVVSVAVSDGNSAGVLFVARPTSLDPGTTGTLLWAAPGAKNVSITPMGGAALDLKGQVSTGSVEINPTAASTKYTLVADGVSREVTVTRKPEITLFAPAKTTAKPGQMLTLTWRTTNATKITLGGLGRATLKEALDATVAMGSFDDTVPAVALGSVLSYQLEATGPGGTTSAQVQVVVGDLPAVTSFTAPVYGLIGGTTKLSWTTLNADRATVSTDGGTLFATNEPAAVADGGVSLPTPTQETTYAFAAINTVTGETAQQSRTVTPVGTVATATLTAMPTTIAAAGTPVMLTWAAMNARRARVLQDGELTVAYVEGVGAESGTITVYPNRATTTYQLVADNTIEAPVTANAPVTVTTPSRLVAANGGSVFDTSGTIDLTWSVGSTPAAVVGFPHLLVDTASASTGFVDIAATGTAITFPSTNDGVALVTLPGFETFLYGSRLATPISVSTNGWFAFSSTALSALATTPAMFPNTTSPSNLIAPFWADLDLGMTGRVYWKINGTAPLRTLVVQYDHVRLAGQMTSDLTFQVQITQAGVVTFEYGTMTFMPPTSAPIIGLQGTGGVGLTALQAGSMTSAKFFGPKMAPVQFSASGLPVSTFVTVGMGLVRLDSISALRGSNVGISEVMFGPHAAYSTGQWFEVFNTNNEPISMAGWTIDFGAGVTHVIDAGLTIPPNGFVVLGQDTQGMNNDNVATDYAYGPLAMTTPGSVSLVGPAPTKVGWGVATDGGFLSFAGAIDAGASVVFDPGPYLLASDPSTAKPSPRACAATAPFGAASPQQFGTPGAASSCFHGRMTRIPSRFVDISATGTPLTFAGSADEGLAVVALSPPARINGLTVSSLTVSTNGWAAPSTQTSAAFTNKTRPTTADPTGSVLAIFWDDLEFQATNANGFAKRFAQGEDAQTPAPHWVIEWAHIGRFFDPSDLNFEIMLFDDGTIEYHYGNMTYASNVNGLSATVWFENAAGTAALTSSVNTASVLPNTALRFSPIP